MEFLERGDTIEPCPITMFIILNKNKIFIKVNIRMNI